MDVAISTLRAELSTWIERARSGEEVVVTERGTPVARLLAVDTAPLLNQLITSGVLSKPRRDDRPAARGAARAHASEQSRAEVLWEDFWAATRTVELTETITAHAGHLASRHALRGADAVHLASLLAVGAAETLFAVWDQKLRTGAEAAGVRLAPMA